MQLLFMSNLYPPFDLGGFEQWCNEVAIALQSRGHNVKILTSKFGIKKSYIQENGVIRSLYLQADIDYYNPIDFITRRSRQEKHNLNKLRKAVQQFSPDLIVIWGMWNLSCNLPHLAEQLMPGRVAYYIASYWPMDQDMHFEYWQAPARRKITELIKRPLRVYAVAKLAREGYPPSLKFENVKCCSQFVRDELVNSKKLPITTGVMFGGIDPHPFLDNPATPRFDHPPLRLVYFGSLLPQKGVHTAIEALSILKKKGMSKLVELTLIGGGHPDYVQQLKYQIERNDLAKLVHFAGRVSRDQIPAWLSKFDAFIFPSIWAEPMARTVMEAMACGLVVIASRVGGQVEMLEDGKNSLTFEAGNADDLADKILLMLESPLKYDQLPGNARETVLKKYTLQRWANDFESWLSELINPSCYPR